MKIITNYILRITQTKEALSLVERYELLMKKLSLFEETVFEEWAGQVPHQIEINLQKSLIIRNSDTKELCLNFSPQLFAILREVRYLRLMEKDGIPLVGVQFSNHSEIYRTYTLNLEKTIDWYNKVSTSIFNIRCSVYD